MGIACALDGGCRAQVYEPSGLLHSSVVADNLLSLAMALSCSFSSAKKDSNLSPSLDGDSPWTALRLSSRAGLCLSCRTGAPFRGGLCSHHLTRRLPGQDHVSAIRLRAPSLRVGAVCCPLSQRLSRIPPFFPPAPKALLPWGLCPLLCKQ